MAASSTPVDRAERVMPDRRLKLRLSAGESVPTAVSWLIEDGYLMVTSWCDQTEFTTLSIWGPGEVVIPTMIAAERVLLTSLSAVQVEEWSPTLEEQQRFQNAQIQQLTTLLLLTRVRPAETRLYRLLLWLGERFGRVSSAGVSLSFQDMNLTHKHLAEIAGMTRVTVTKALSRFRQEGKLGRQGSDELLLPGRATEQF